MSTYGDLRVGDRVTFRNGYGLEVTAIRPGASPATVRVTARALDARGEVRFTDERLHRRATKVDGAVTVADIGDVR